MDKALGWVSVVFAVQVLDFHQTFLSGNATVQLFIGFCGAFWLDFSSA
jgi:hypothetical protein